MITSRDKELLVRLIKNYSSNKSTDRMLASIADNTGMLGACQLLIRKNNVDDREVMSWVDDQCYQRKVDLRSFLYEVQQVVSIFQPGQENDEHYLTLGLEVGASDKEIKEAYRELCLRYHPDTTTLNDDAAATAFLEVNKAYHALRNTDERERKQSLPQKPSTHWRQENKTNTVSVSKKRRNIFWFGGLTLLMIVVSILAAGNYQKKAMITGLQLHHAAFIPPQNSDFEEEVKETPVNDASVVKLAKVETEVAANVEAVKIPMEELPRTKTITTIETVAEVPLVNPVEIVETSPREIATEELAVKEEQPEMKNSESALLVPAEKSIDKPEIVIVVKDSNKSKKVFDNSPVQEEVPLSVVAPVTEVTVPEPTPEELHATLQSKIGHFLTNYTEAYEKKDFETFSSFFAGDATENDKTVNSLFPTYIKLFSVASEINFDISILKWSKMQGSIDLDGRFAIRIDYKDGRKVKGSGTISFLLKDLQPEFLIKKMSYQFDKK